MNQAPFCHLHVHTCYSILDSTIKIKDLINEVKKMGMESVAITDHAVLFGTIEFYKAAKSAGIKPIIGCDMYIAKNGIEERKTPRNNKSLVLLAETQEGYENLVKLVSKAHLEGRYYNPRIDKSILRSYAKGLIGLSGNLFGEVSEACRENNLEEAERLAFEYEEIFGKGNFYLELIDNSIPDEQRMDDKWRDLSKDQLNINNHLITISKKTGIPIVATNDVHYLKQEHAQAHDVMTCLQRNQVVSDQDRSRYRGDQLYLKNSDEMISLFNKYPEAISNTIKISKRCNVEFILSTTDNPKKAEDLHFPVFPLPKPYIKADEYLAFLAKKGIADLYEIKDIESPKTEKEKEIKSRLYYEISILKKTNYINYFLVVADFINYARTHGIPVGPGRGSGAGSLLAYCLKITTVDPLAYSLLFERFMNPDRISPPDFDIDFCPTRRQEVIKYVREKYGEDCVAQIITFGTLGAKSLIRDIGRVFQIPLAYCDRLAKMIPETPGMTLEQALKENPEFKDATESQHDARTIMQYARVLEGLPRHTGMHAAGVVIGEKPLIDIIPLTKEQKENLTVVQFEKGASEAIGLLKMDFLGLKNLTVIYDACELIKRNHGITIDPETLPLDDPKVYELLAKGDTVGVFQLESAGMRDTLRYVAPDCIQDIIAVIALYRPGPMDYIPNFAKRKRGEESVKYDHELLEPILKETYGIMVYQEQIMQTAQILAGFTLAQGDILRSAIGKKKADVIADQREAFISGCKEANGIEQKLAETIFNNIEKFAQYGFNKSHSVVYAIIAYQTGWLKANYKGEFMAALLSSEMTNTDKLKSIISESGKIDLQILPPCVNESIGKFNVTDKNAIRFGMAAIKGVGEGISEDIVNERDTNGEFIGFIDFCTRMNAPNRKVMEGLVRSGAFDFCKVHRSKLFGNIDMALSRASETIKDKITGQQNFFDMTFDKDGTSPDQELKNYQEWSESRMLSDERELLGMYVSGHPLHQYEWIIKECGIHKIEDISNMKHEQPFRLGGMITDFKKLYTKAQAAMAVFKVESLKKDIQAVMFPEAFEKYGDMVYEESLVMIGGVVHIEEGGDAKIQVLELTHLEKAPKIYSKNITIHIQENEALNHKLEAIKSAIKKSPGNTPLSICLECINGKKVTMEAEHIYKINPSQKLIYELQKYLGKDKVLFNSKDVVLLEPIKRKKFKKNR